MPYPITTQSLTVVQILERILNLSGEQAAHLAHIMWFFRSWGDRIFGAPFAAVMYLEPRDPREALDAAGAALLAQRQTHGGDWRIANKIHPDPTVPGGFTFTARKVYLWCPEVPSFSLSSAQVEAQASARVSGDGKRVLFSLVFQDEWAWAFEQGRREAENSWNVVLTSLAQRMAVEVVKAPSWPPPSPYPFPYLAAEPYVNRAKELRTQNDYAGAVAAYDQALAIDPYSPTSFGNRAVCRFLMGDLARAIEDATRSIELNPSDPGSYANRSEWLRMRGLVREALADAETAARLKPQDSVMFLTRARALSELGERDRARADYRMALQLNPNDTRARDELAAIGG